MTWKRVTRNRVEAQHCSVPFQESAMIDDPHGIRKMRKSRGWTERELARRAGVPYQRVQSLEVPTKKGGVPYSRVLPRIMAALGNGAAHPEDARFKTVG